MIVAEQKVQIYVRTSDKNSISIHYPRNEEEPKIFYRVSNDTLFVFEATSQNQQQPPFVNIYVTSLSSLVAENNYNVHLGDFSSEKLEINAEQAHISFHNSSMGEVIIQADHSEILMYSTKVASITGRLENDSRLRCDSKGILKMEVVKDQNSQFNFY